MGDAIPINLSSDEDSEELVMDWRCTPSKPNSIYKSTPGLFLVDTPVKTLNPMTMPMRPDGMDPICLDSDSETTQIIDSKENKKGPASDNINHMAPKNFPNVSEINVGTPSLVATNLIEKFQSMEKAALVTVFQELPQANSAHMSDSGFSETISKSLFSLQNYKDNAEDSVGNNACQDFSIDTGALPTEKVGSFDNFNTNSAREVRLKFPAREVTLKFPEDITRSGSSQSYKKHEIDTLNMIETSTWIINPHMPLPEDSVCYKHQVVDESLMKVISSKQKDKNKVNTADGQKRRRKEEVSKIWKQKEDKIRQAEENRLKKEQILKRKKEKEEERIHQREEKRLKKEEEKQQQDAEKAEADKQKKHRKELEKWAKGKYALKSISAQIDTGVIEKGLIAGQLLQRLTAKDFSYRIASNPIKSSILWQIKIPDEEEPSTSKEHAIQYIAVLLEAEEFCNIVSAGSLNDHILTIQRTYPGYNICYITNKLMSFVHKKEQEKYGNPSCTSCWNHLTIEETLARFSSHFVGVRSRLCLDEAEVAEHIVGLTRSLAVCRFRKKSTLFTINANGSHIPKDRAYKDKLKKDSWLKVLVAIPKLPPNCALAISKMFTTMRSVLNVYLDPHRTVNEKEFLLQDLITEGPLGDNGRRLGHVCSKRVYRFFMANCGNLKMDEVENGADFSGYFE